MPHVPGKFCIDRNMVRWTLINGVINRKTNQDEPTGGQDVSIEEIRAIERTIVRTSTRNRMGWPLVLFAALLLVAAWGSASIIFRFVMGFAGLASVDSGVEKLRRKVTIHDAFRLVIPGRNSQEWTVVGSTPEVLGFIRGVELELSSPASAIGS